MFRKNSYYVWALIQADFYGGGWQGATNRVQKVQMYDSKLVLHAKFLEAVQSFGRQYNILLLSFVYSEPVFFIDRKLLCVFLYLNRLIWMSKQFLIVPLMFLKS